jgi:hypothetical protein
MQNVCGREMGLVMLSYFLLYSLCDVYYELGFILYIHITILTHINIYIKYIQRIKKASTHSKFGGKNVRRRKRGGRALGERFPLHLHILEN